MKSLFKKKYIVFVLCFHNTVQSALVTTYPQRPHFFDSLERGFSLKYVLKEPVYKDTPVYKDHFVWFAWAVAIYRFHYLICWIDCVGLNKWSHIWFCFNFWYCNHNSLLNIYTYWANTDLYNSWTKEHKTPCTQNKNSTSWSCFAISHPNGRFELGRNTKAFGHDSRYINLIFNRDVSCFQFICSFSLKLLNAASPTNNKYMNHIK